MPETPLFHVPALPMTGAARDPAGVIRFESATTPIPGNPRLATRRPNRAVTCWATVS